MQFKLNTLLLLILTAIASISISALVFRGDSYSGGGSKKEVEQVVADYIANHPEKILESLRKGSDQVRKGEGERAKKFLSANADKLVDVPHAPIAGNAKGDVAIVEFIDYSCGYCRKSHADVAKLIDEDSNLKLVIRQFPVLGPGSEVAARAALAVQKFDPDKFTRFHAALLKMQGQKTEENIITTAMELGIDNLRLREHMKSKEIEAALKADQEIGQQVGVRGTPAFVVGDQFIPGAVGYDSLKNAVQNVRKARQGEEKKAG